LNRQILRLSKSATESSAAIRGLRAENARILAKRDSCRKGCDGLPIGEARLCVGACTHATSGALAAARKTIASRQRTCQLTVQSILALKDKGAALAGECRIRNEISTPASTICD
jgi:hypothetical protein